jgi:hypothetical protein
LRKETSSNLAIAITSSTTLAKNLSPLVDGMRGLLLTVAENNGTVCHVVALAEIFGEPDESDYKASNVIVVFQMR